MNAIEASSVLRMTYIGVYILTCVCINTQPHIHRKYAKNVPKSKQSRLDIVRSISDKKAWEVIFCKFEVDAQAHTYPHTYTRRYTHNQAHLHHFIQFHAKYCGKFVHLCVCVFVQCTVLLLNCHSSVSSEF